MNKVAIRVFSEPDIMWKERWLRTVEEGHNDGENDDEVEDGDGQADLHLPLRLPGRHPGPRCPHIPPRQVGAFPHQSYCLEKLGSSLIPILPHRGSDLHSWPQSRRPDRPFSSRNANLGFTSSSLHQVLPRFGFAILFFLSPYFIWICHIIVIGVSWMWQNWHFNPYNVSRRNFDLDFLDSVRTKAPCGMPKGLCHPGHHHHRQGILDKDQHKYETLILKMVALYLEVFLVKNPWRNTKREAGTC